MAVEDLSWIPSNGQAARLSDMLQLVTENSGGRPAHMRAEQRACPKRRENSSEHNCSFRGAGSLGWARECKAGPRREREPGTIGSVSFPQLSQQGYMKPSERQKLPAGVSLSGRGGRPGTPIDDTHRGLSVVRPRHRGMAMEVGEDPYADDRRR